MSENDVLERLHQFSEMGEDWDYEGAQQIQVAAIEAARASLSRLNPMPDHVAPCHNGGLQFEWYSSSRDVEMEFRPDGRMDVLVTPKLDGVCLWDQCVELSDVARALEKAPAPPQ